MTKLGKPKISVIVPVYKVEKYLDRCVESIVNQTYKNLEIILVDDGSPDSCPEMCNVWANKDERIKVIHKENGGVSSARNVGLDASSGDYVGFIDGDDIIDSDMYEMLLDNLVSTGADISRCGMVREDDGGYKEVWGDENAEAFTMNQIQGIQSVGAAEGILPVSPCNKLFKMSQVLDIRFDTSLVYAEDTLFNYEAMKKAQKIVCQDKPMYHYIRNGESASHKNFNTARFDEHKVTDIIMSREIGNPETYPYCVKGDVLKTFRTIKQMMVADTETDKFNEMRMRVVSHRKEIFSSGLYSKASILKTVFLWLCPSLYKIFIELYGKHSNRRYNKKVNG